MSKVKKDYELRVTARGARIRLKEINSAQYKFWSKKPESDLLSYLESGPEDFEDFSVPTPASLSYMADAEKDLALFFFAGDNREYAMELPEMPLDLFAIEGVESVELIEITGTKRKTLERATEFLVPQLTSGDEEEGVDISVRASRYNLITIEQVENEWIYKWNGLDSVPTLGDMRYIPVNGEDANLEEYLGDGSLVWDVVLAGLVCDERDVNHEDAGDSFAMVIQR